MVFRVLPTVNNIGTHEINYTLYVDKGVPYSADMLDNEEAVILKYIVTIEAVNDKPVIALVTANAGGAFKAELTLSDEETANASLKVNYTLVRNGVEISPKEGVFLLLEREPSL